MHNLIKKISIVFLIISLGWLPTQVTFASLLTMPVARVSAESASAEIIPVSIVKSAVLFQDSQQAMKSMSHCEMHQIVKDCCAKDATCHSANQKCGNCLSFIAMVYEMQQALFIPRYTAHYVDNHTLSGMVAISAYRPPR